MGEYDLTAITAARRSMKEAERELIRLSLAAVKDGHAIETGPKPQPSCPPQSTNGITMTMLSKRIGHG